MPDKDCSGYRDHSQFEEDFREALGRLGTDPAYRQAFLDDPTNVTRDYCLTHGMYGALLSTYEHFQVASSGPAARGHGVRMRHVRQN